MQVKSLFISALLSPLPDTLASAITPHDGLEVSTYILDHSLKLGRLNRCIGNANIASSTFAELSTPTQLSTEI